MRSKCRWRRRVVAAAVAAGGLGGAVMASGSAQAVVGGTPTAWADHPHFVQILELHPDGTLSKCGGSVIDTDVVLTAAHCVNDVGGDPSRVVMSFVTDQTRVGVTLTIHPLYNGNIGDGHDLAIVGLAPGSTLGVTPVVVGAPGDSGVTAPGTDAYFAGHGLTHGGGTGTRDLHELHTVLRSDDDMDDIYNPWYWFDSWDATLMIGAGFSNHTICHGDSGGPLVVHRGETTVQVGVANFVDTWGEDCDAAGGFAELAGPQLAWLGARVPGITTRWDGCVDPNGIARRWVTTYSVAGAVRGPEHQADGSNYMWTITCGSPPVTNTPPPRTSPPPPPPPPGPDCRRLRCQTQ